MWSQRNRQHVAPKGRLTSTGMSAMWLGEQRFVRVRYTPPVRRLVLLFLLAVLPLQFAWGAAAAYCGHEKAPSAGHFGHHSHQHQAKAESDSGSAAKKASVLADDLDCAFCHLGCVQPCASQTTSVAAIQSSVLALTTLHLPDSGRPGRIERPKWALAA